MVVDPDTRKDEQRKDDDENNDGKQLVTHRIPSEDGSIGSSWKGAWVITIVLGYLAVGPLLLVWIPALALLGYFKIAGTLAAFIAAHMILARPSSSWCLWYLQAAAWFRKGVYLHFEKRAIRAIGKSPSLWCMHPHGTSVGFGFSLNGSVRFRAHQPDKYVPLELQQVLSLERQLSCVGVMAPVLFRIPLFRNLLLGFGCCTPATKQGMNSLFLRRLDFGMLPGGMEEVALYTFQQEHVFLSPRKGFIKYALQHGYLLIPGYTFGECDLYQSMTSGAQLRLWMQRHLGFVVPFFWGPLWYAPWLPRRDVALQTVMGAPVQLPRIEDPSEADVAIWHASYVAALKEVFDTHKGRFGYGDRELEIG